MSGHVTVAERLDRDRQQVALARERIAEVEDLTARTQSALEQGDEFLGNLDRGLEMAQDAATSVRRLAPRVVFIAAGVVVGVGIFVVIRRRKAQRDENLG